MALDGNDISHCSPYDFSQHEITLEITNKCAGFFVYKDFYEYVAHIVSICVGGTVVYLEKEK